MTKKVLIKDKNELMNRPQWRAFNSFNKRVGTSK